MPTKKVELNDVEAACELLVRLIHAKRLRLGKIDDDMGHARGYLSRVLKGRARLTYDYLLLVLREMEVEPGFFFSILHPLPEDSAPAPMRPARVDYANLQALVEELRQTLALGGRPGVGVPAVAGSDLEARMQAAVEGLVAKEARTRTSPGRGRAKPRR